MIADKEIVIVNDININVKSLSKKDLGTFKYNEQDIKLDFLNDVPIKEANIKNNTLSIWLDTDDEKILNIIQNTIKFYNLLHTDEQYINEIIDDNESIDIYDTITEDVKELPKDKPLVSLTPAEEIEPEKKNEGMPLTPLTPAEEIKPEQPDVPLTPLTPAEPVEPEKPDVPLTPIEPSEPVEPENPGTPLVPLIPAEPVEPETPDTPLTPLEPAEEIEPEQPNTPLVPLTPSEPIEPEKPLSKVEGFNSGKTMNAEQFRQEFLTLINEERAKLGRTPLVYSKVLEKGTEQRATELAEFGYLRTCEKLDQKHTRPNGESSFRTAFDYTSKYEEFKGGNLGENTLMQGLPSEEVYPDTKWHDEHAPVDCTISEALTNPKLLAKSTFEQWKHSQGHYDNMMNEDYKSFWISVKINEGMKHPDNPTAPKDMNYTTLIGVTVFDILNTEDYSKPTEVVKPVEPVEPVKPVESTETTKPVETTEPTETTTEPAVITPIKEVPAVVPEIEVKPAA